MDWRRYWRLLPRRGYESLAQGGGFAEPWVRVVLRDLPCKGNRFSARAQDRIVIEIGKRPFYRPYEGRPCG
jgi:hypothetical protein